DGIDSVRFIVALNAGLDFAPLSKATSGGEGARLMLSLKSVLNSLDPYDLLVLDEVDTGVSGRVASLVARKIRTIAESSQVLVISHLPQVVASATIGVRISKKVVDGKTYTTASQLSDGDFVLSIGSMLSGSSLTEEAKEQAEKLIEEFR
ncbi:MAG: DNA repair protein RecN, partial [Bacilli bacterium]